MKKILIVEDSKVVRNFIIKCLKEIGLTDYDEAIDGQEALDKAKISMPDAILLDWNMPAMNRQTFLQNLRALPEGSKSIVIFCTNENELSKASQTASNTTDEYILKPFDADMLRAKFLQLGLL